MLQFFRRLGLRCYGCAGGSISVAIATVGHGRGVPCVVLFVRIHQAKGDTGLTRLLLRLLEALEDLFPVVNQRVSQVLELVLHVEEVFLYFATLFLQIVQLLLELLHHRRLIGDLPFQRIDLSELLFHLKLQIRGFVFGGDLGLRRLSQLFLDHVQLFTNHLAITHVFQSLLIALAQILKGFHLGTHHALILRLLFGEELFALLQLMIQASEILG